MLFQGGDRIVNRVDECFDSGWHQVLKTRWNEWTRGTTRAAGGDYQDLGGGSRYSCRNCARCDSTLLFSEPMHLVVLVIGPVAW